MAFACIEDEHKLTLRKWDSVSGFTLHISVTSAIPQTATPDQTSQKQNVKLKLKHFPSILNHLKHTSSSRPPINVKHYVVVSETTCHGCSASRIQPSHLLGSAHQWQPYWNCINTWIQVWNTYDFQFVTTPSCYLAWIKDRHSGCRVPHL